MKAHELARRANMSVHTVRFYARCGLLAPSRNQFNNYREYTERDLTRLRFIEVSKCLGLTLDEIRAVFATNELDGSLRDLLQVAFRQHLAEHESAIEQLSTRRHAIDRILGAWDELPFETNDVMALCDAMRQLARLDSQPAPALARLAHPRMESRPGAPLRRTGLVGVSSDIADTTASPPDGTGTSRPGRSAKGGLDPRSPLESVDWLYAPHPTLAICE